MERSTPELSFRESMSGHFALGTTDPDQGSEAGKAAGNRLTLNAEITIRDMDRFIADPDHVGEMEARIDLDALGGSFPAKRATFDLFSPSDRPELKLMVYELAITAQGMDYYFAGRKEIRDDPGLDLWADTTTLRVRLHEGSSTAGPVVGAGVLTISVPELLRLTASMRVRNARSPAEAAAVVGAFGRFFMGALWDTYSPAWTRRPPLWRRLWDRLLGLRGPAGGS